MTPRPGKQDWIVDPVQSREHELRFGWLSLAAVVIAAFALAAVVVAIGGVS